MKKTACWVVAALLVGLVIMLGVDWVADEFQPSEGQVLLFGAVTAMLLSLASGALHIRAASMSCAEDMDRVRNTVNSMMERERAMLVEIQKLHAFVERCEREH